jgi:hypothetical protein
VKTVTLTLTATDQCGRNASDDQIITYVDTTPPVFTGTCAGNAIQDAVLSCNSTSIPAAPTCTAFDACGPVTVTPACCSEGDKLKRTWALRDTCGNAGVTKAQFVKFGLSTCPA